MKTIIKYPKTFTILVLGLLVVIFSGNSQPTVQKQEKVEVVATTTNSTTTVATEVKTPTVKEVKSVVVDKKVNPTSSEYKVTDVVDGDTVKVSMNGTVETLRIIGLNTPETLDPRKPVECFGKEASNKAKELLTGKTVTLEADPSQTESDKYGRLLRFVFVDGMDYGKYMIANGYAYEYTYSSAYKYQKEYKQAQINAQTNQLGLWSKNTCNGLKELAPIPVQNTPAITYYTSSHSSSKYYYPASCEGWKSLTASYLKGFSTLDELLKKYPTKIISPQCQ
ncbi:MAG: hypothetical protein RLZZ308_240 [Candidatus Parcubacteria bacterium]|jgi:endonuclease YncB( thermonuclease family)